MDENCCFRNTIGCCRILIKGKCHNCKFYKSEEQLRQERQATKQKLMLSGLWDYYSDKYPIIDRLK